MPSHLGTSILDLQTQLKLFICYFRLVDISQCSDRKPYILKKKKTLCQCDNHQANKVWYKNKINLHKKEQHQVAPDTDHQGTETNGTYYTQVHWSWDHKIHCTCSMNHAGKQKRKKHLILIIKSKIWQELWKSVAIHTLLKCLKIWTRYITQISRLYRCPKAVVRNLFCIMAPFHGPLSLAAPQGRKEW